MHLGSRDDHAVTVCLSVPSGRQPEGRIGFNGNNICSLCGKKIKDHDLVAAFLCVSGR